MPEATIAVGRGVSIHDILYPSFARPLFDFSDDGRVAVKRWGYCSQTLLISREGYITIKYHDSECLDYSLYLTGVWMNSQSLRSSDLKILGDVAEPLLEAYGTLGVSVSPLDDYVVFTSIFLSRNTDYDRNTIRWVRELLYTLGDPSRLARIDSSLLKGLSSSYQVRQLSRALNCYNSIRDKVMRGSSKELLKCNNVGPKVYHSYLLHVLLKKDIAPVDVNLISFLKKFSVPVSDYRKPEKKYCIIHDCEACPLSSRCLTSFLRRELGEAFGWLQNVAYYHSKKYCQSSRCNQCPLKTSCKPKGFRS